MHEDLHGYVVKIGALGADLRVAPAATESDTAIVEHTLPPGRLAGPRHRHRNEDEISYVLDGEMGVEQGGRVTTVGAGEFIVKPRGEWHTFWNAGAEELRLLEVIAPGEFAGYFEEVAAALPDGPPDEATMQRLGEIAAAYDLELEPESVPELMAEHGVEL